MMVGDIEERKEIEKNIKKDVAKAKQKLIRQAKKQGYGKISGRKNLEV